MIKGKKNSVVSDSKSNPAASSSSHAKSPLTSSSGAKLIRTHSSRPVRLFATCSRASSFRSRPSMKKKNKSVVVNTTTSNILDGEEMSDGSVHQSNATKSTCSSKFKTAIFPTGAGGYDHTQASASKKKVCPYTYCSLHGRRRHSDNPPQLRRLVSLSRRRGPLLRPHRMAIKPSSLNLVNKPNAQESAHDYVMPTNLHTPTEKNLVTANWHISQEGLHPLKADDHSFCCSQNCQAQDRVGEVSTTPNYLSPPKSTITNLDEMNEDHSSKLPNNMSAIHVTEKPSRGNEKSTRIWRLIYHSMLSARYWSELYPPEGAVDSDKIDATDEASSSKVTGGEIHNAELQTINKSQVDAIKLVEEAIDDIFLPDVGDHQLSENQPLTSSNMESGEGLLESNQHHLSCIVANSSGPVEKLKDDTAKTVNPFLKLGSESMSKNWGKLKQVILLKRFVKALDKVRELRFRDPQQLAMDPNPEIQKVNLRRQTTDEKKLADDWMLDYALRQVVAKLTPARRKKVELLIEAFETVIPLSENETSLNQYKPISTHPKSSLPLPTENTILSSNAFTELTLESVSIAEDSENLIAEAPSIVLREDLILARDLGGETTSLASQEQPVIDISFLQQIGSEDAPMVQDEVPSEFPHMDTLEHISCSLYDQSSAGPISHYDCEPQGHIEKKSMSYTACSPSIGSGNLKEGKMTSNTSLSLQELPLPSDPVKQAENDTQLDNQKYFKMWGMIYNRVVSGSAAKIGNQLHITGSDDREEVSDSRFDAVKLVEDALDEMLLPEYQDQSADERSITSDQDDLERVDSKSGDPDISTSNDPYHHYFKDFNQMKTKTAGEARRKCDITIHTEQPHIAESAGSITNRLRTNGWSNLKKFILLKRFIRAVEKLKKYNPREPRSLSVEPDPEPEKVSLRRQTTDERLSADQWMIDHAIQQVVARLTPARKRRVELLVEAFETVEAVLPKSETRTPLKHSIASPHAKHCPSIVSRQGSST